jgi:DNA-binding beta-propeller fold protein YncE
MARNFRRVAKLAGVLLLLAASLPASKHPKQLPALPPPADLQLEGGRKLIYERSFSSEQEVRKKPGFFGKLLNVVAGPPDMHALVRPYSIAVDSHGRAIITDPGAGGIHIFDFEQKKYKFIERYEKGRDAMVVPQCVAVDAQDNIYVTDSAVGKIFVFGPDGKYRRALGSLKGGEGYFKRPTGIAVDSAAQRIFVTDTLRNKIFMLDMQGSVLRTIGKSGQENGEFNYPTELKLEGRELAVVDAMNFRVQLLREDGTFEKAIGEIGDSTGTTFRPKGVAIDSEHHYYVVDGLWGIVQVFDREGRLLYYFGKRGTAPGDFQLPTGVFIDRGDRIFVVDSYNRRIQVFHYFAQKQAAGGGL